MSFFVGLVALVFAGFAFFTLCSNFLYWYETLNADDSLIPRENPGPLLCLYQYFQGLAGYMLCVLLVPVGFFWRKKPAAIRQGQDPTLPPVILIHGLNNTASVWLYLGRLLEKGGYRISTYSYSSFFVPLENIVSGLEEHVRKVEALNPGSKPVLVTHSLGGIIARVWLLNEKNHARLGALFTFGTPHSGSKLAAMAPGALAKNITPKSALISRLREAAPIRGPYCVAFASPADEAVIPATSLVPPAGWRLLVTGRVGHFSMLFCPRMGELLLSELDAFKKSVEGNS